MVAFRRLQHDMVSIRILDKTDESLMPGLAELLQDSVNGGASVGFLRPLSVATASNYWRAVFRSLGNETLLWVAEADGQIAGSVQLALCQKENGMHRAEVQKLFVSSRYRGGGIASKLMQALEEFARANGRTLLVLDTEAGSKAEAVYAHLGWTRVAEIPDYATTPDGTLHPTVIFYKRT